VCGEDLGRTAICTDHDGGLSDRTIRNVRQSVDVHFVIRCRAEIVEKVLFRAGYDNSARTIGFNSPTEVALYYHVFWSTK
jgi:hypothetical protein